MIFYFIIICIVVLDQITKYLAEIYLKPIGTFPLIKGVFHLTYRRNTGAAFSILEDKQLLLILTTSIVIIALIVYFFRILDHPNMLLKVGISFIIGGAIGNLIDRIRLNYVIDFFDFNLINFAVFNVADTFIVIGSILLGYVVLFQNVEI